MADYSLIPEQLKNVRRWLLWRSIPVENKKPKKIPYYTNGKARNGSLDNPDDYLQLVAFSEALAALSSAQVGYYAGLGFAFGRDDVGNYWQGIDLDGIRSHPELEELVCSLPGYVEESPSGDGVHAIGYGEAFSALASNRSGIEAYSTGRYFTVTGKALKQSFEIECLKSFIEEHLVKLHGGGKKESSTGGADPVTYQPVNINDQLINDLQSALNHLNSDDYGLWIKIGHCLKEIGEQGRSLFLEWSQTSEKYDEKHDARRWYGFNPSRSGYLGVFAEAKQAGWVNPSIERAKVRKEQRQARLPTPGQITQEPTEQPIIRPPLAFKLISCDDLMQREFKPDWLIHGIIERKSMGLIFGNSASGKSLVVQDMCFCIGAGLKFKSRKVKQGKVVYVAGEGFNGLQKRFKALSIHYRTPTQNVYFSEQSGDFMSAGSSYDVAEAVKAVGDVALIVIDTLHRNMAGDENSAKDMAQFFMNIDMHLRPLGAAVLIIHHSGHDTKERSRGSSSIRAAMDSEYMIKKDDMLVTIENTKMKDYEPMPPLDLRLKVIDTGQVCEDGFQITSVVLDELLSESKLMVSGIKKQVLDALEIAISEHGYNLRMVDVEVWRKTFYKNTTDVKNQRRNFLESKNYLLEKELVYQVNFDFGIVQ